MKLRVSLGFLPLLNPERSGVRLEHRKVDRFKRRKVDRLERQKVTLTDT